MVKALSERIKRILNKKPKVNYEVKVYKLTGKRIISNEASALKFVKEYRDVFSAGNNTIRRTYIPARAHGLIVIQEISLNSERVKSVWWWVFKPFADRYVIVKADGIPAHVSSELNEIRVAMIAKPYFER